MNTIGYLKEIYGYSTPIFLKDIRIGRKSKVAIRKELSRAVEKGEIARKAQGIYWFKEDTDIPRDLSFEDVIRAKFVVNDYGMPGLDVDIFGYYSGTTFLHIIGLTQQVPAILEVVTNKTSCTRIYCCDGYRVLLRRPKTTIDRTNYKILQFLDAINSLTREEIEEHKQLIFNYIKNNLSKSSLERYVSLYPTAVIKNIFETGLAYAFR